jgi:peptidoglycan/LPS O-acetylase OafA/YrhL
MSEHEVSSRAGSAGGPGPSGRVEEFLAGVYALQIPSQTERRERRLFLAGFVIAIAGFAVIGVGWWGASGTKYAYQEIPYVISGGIVGVSLVIVGAALFARYSAARLLRFWLARLVADQQIQTDRVVDAIAALTEAVKSQTASADERSH